MPNINTKNLANRKNLLAFSAGVDSSALFFLLIENHIKFDIAIVDYGIREQSKTEVAHARALAQKHKLHCHTIAAPQYESHFEQKARDFRYKFFESLVTLEGYENILTAHQLDDQLEWLLMRLVKGAGLSELLGLTPISQRESYTLIRPLLAYSKQELLAYLQSHKYPYFVDESNSDEKYERNLFRKQFSQKLLSEYAEGIKRSFDYLHKDKEILESGFTLLHQEKQLHIIKLHLPSAKVKAADISLKLLGYLLSAPQRQEIARETSLVVGGIWVVEIQNDLLYIAPHTTTDMPKTFKEKCRVSKIPRKIRPYLYRENIDIF